MAKNVKIHKKIDKPKADFELSSGALVFRRAPEGVFWLVLHYSAGHWDFPKGHVEKGESLVEAAKREVFEEAGIKDLKFYPEFKKSIQYFYNPSKYKNDKKTKLAFKKVVFHLAETSEKEIKTSFEHLEGKWLKTEEAEKTLTFKNARTILQEAAGFLSQSFCGKIE